MAKKSDKIAIFDSGMGGLSFLHAAGRLLPHEDFIYYGDLANAPYGEKSPEFIRQRAAEIVDLLLSYGVKAVVLACNTATSAAVGYLRERYPQLNILGMEPAIRLTAKEGEHRVIVLSTPITAQGPNTRRLIENNRSLLDEVVNIACPGLMELVEAYTEAGAAENKRLCQAYLRAKLEPLLGENEQAAVVLGCTHYIFLEPWLRELYPEVHIYHGNPGTARNLQRILTEQNLLTTRRTEGGTVFLSSVDRAEFTEKAKIFLGRLEKQA